jgi:DNA-directed RNA polymerase sigma subunit (sigma70/sigma32)
MDTLELNLYSTQIMDVAKDLFKDKPRYLEILEARSVHKTTIKSLSVEYGVCQERIRQIEAKAMRMLLNKLRILANPI